MEPTPDPALEGGEQLKELERRLAVFNYECDLMEKCITHQIPERVNNFETLW